MSPNPVTPDRITTICEREWPAHQSDCSRFVKAVAAQLGIVLTGLADDIVDQIKNPPWQTLADGPAAKDAAEAGMLVVGGLKGSAEQHPSAHGHVVVVVAGPLCRNAYPTAYWGKLGSSGRKATTVNWAWRAGDRDHVTYAARRVQSGFSQPRRGQ